MRGAGTEARKGSRFPSRPGGREGLAGGRSAVWPLGGAAAPPAGTGSESGRRAEPGRSLGRAGKQEPAVPSVGHGDILPTGPYEQQGCGVPVLLKWRMLQPQSGFSVRSRPSPTAALPAERCGSFSFFFKSKLSAHTRRGKVLSASHPLNRAICLLQWCLYVHGMGV